MKENTRYILIGIGVVLVGLILWYFSSVVAYILIAAVISLIGHPLVDLLAKVKIKKFQIGRSFGAAITLVLLLFLVYCFFRTFIPIVVKQLHDLSKIDVNFVLSQLEEPIKKIESFVPDKNFSIEALAKEKMMALFHGSMVSNLFSSVAGMLGNIFIAIFSISFLSFFFLRERDLFMNGVLLFTPQQYEENVRHIAASISKLLIRYFIGLTIESTMVMIFVTIGLSIAGLPFNNVLIIALLVGILNVIPYVGPLIGGLMGMVITIVTNIHSDFYSEVLPMLGFMVIVLIAVRIIDDILFQPLIYSSSVKAHPLEIFLVILLAGSFGGIIGMVLAIPGYTVFRVIAKEFFQNYKIIKKITQNI